MGSKRKKKYRTSYEEYNIYYGIPHCHTNASTGRGTVLEAIQYCKNNSLDYIIFTDHSSHLGKKDKVKEGNSPWFQQKSSISKYTKNHKNFLPVLGFEYRLVSRLDINIFGTKDFIANKLTIKDFIKWLSDNRAIGIINHPDDSIDKIKNIIQMNKFIRSIEVGNGSYPYKYKRYYRQFFQMLDLGWKLGAVNGQDNHRKNWGDTENVTAVLSHKLSTASLIEAYSLRHTYSTESKTLRIFFSINNSIMGETVCSKSNEPLVFRISAEDKARPIEGVKLYTKGGIVFKEDFKSSPGNYYELTFSIDCPDSSTWFVVNIIEADGKEALTSPIFITVR